MSSPSPIFTAESLAFAHDSEIAQGGMLPEPLAPIVCMSHLRWDFVFQRPQHLMTRFARERPVLYIEEPVDGIGETRMETRMPCDNVTVSMPVIPGLHELSVLQRQEMVRLLIEKSIAEWMLPLGRRPVLWLYTPLALPQVENVDASMMVYDCMDELANFKDAPTELATAEQALLQRADLVFTGGYSLYEAKRRSHPHVHPFPSSVDIEHFRAPASGPMPEDMAALPGPRIGFYGVIDERFDAVLLEEVARLRPQWQWVILGPIVKIDPASLPQAANIHYVGSRSYDELPRYLAAWDVAMMPFAINAATRYISPTKTPEYLAGSKPVVSTPIADVVSMYGDSGLVHIARDATAFVRAIGKALQQTGTPEFEVAARAFLAGMSWDKTQAQMAELIDHGRPRANRSRGYLVENTAAVSPSVPPAADELQAA